MLLAAERQVHKHLVQWRVSLSGRSLIHRVQERSNACKYTHAHGTRMHTFSKKKILDFGEKWPGRATGNKEFFWLGLIFPLKRANVEINWSEFCDQFSPVITHIRLYWRKHDAFVKDTVIDRSFHTGATDEVHRRNVPLIVLCLSFFVLVSQSGYHCLLQTKHHTHYKFTM